MTGKDDSGKKRCIGTRTTYKTHMYYIPPHKLCTECGRPVYTAFTYMGQYITDSHSFCFIKTQ